MKHFSILACVAVLAVASPGLAQAQVDGPAVARLGTVEFQPCTLKAQGLPMTVAARCANLRVPEDHAQPGGRMLDIPVAWIPSSGRRAAADPVLLLAGGPGQSALDVFASVEPAFRDLQRERDVILVDQRGTGRANTLACPQTMRDPRWNSTEIVGADTAREMTRACLAEIRDADPRLYTTSDYIADLEFARKALGIGQFNLVGVSYGTRVALEYLRRHPSSLRSVVLDSVVPPTLILGTDHARNLDAAIDRQFAQCAADKVCSERFGQPRAKLDALLERLRAQPVEVTYMDPLSGERRTDRLTAEAVASVVRLHA
jgi:pimeloyl-ACP methyl ester carboxylesterase